MKENQRKMKGKPIQTEKQKKSPPPKKNPKKDPNPFYLGFGSSSPHFWEFGGVCMGFSWGWIESQLNLIPIMVDGIDPFLGIGWAFGGLLMGLWWVVNGVNCELLGVWFPINPFVGIVGVCVFHEVWWGWIENQLILIPTIVEGTDPFVGMWWYWKWKMFVVIWGCGGLAGTPWWPTHGISWQTLADGREKTCVNGAGLPGIWLDFSMIFISLFWAVPGLEWEQTWFPVGFHWGTCGARKI